MNGGKRMSVSPSQPSRNPRIETVSEAVVVAVDGPEDTTIRPRKKFIRGDLEKRGEDSGIAIFEVRDRHFLEHPLDPETLALLDSPSHVVIDMQNRDQVVTAMGVQNLREIQVRLKQGGKRLVLCNTPAPLSKLLAMLVLSEQFEVQPDIAGAVTALTFESKQQE